MNHKRFTLALSLFFFFSFVQAQTITLDELKAFPTAEGAGRYTTGGRGGDVYWVTSPDASGAGTLQGALGSANPRTILFGIGGGIPLNYEVYSEQSPNITIAGQTANDIGGVYYDTNGGWEDVIYIIGDNLIFRYFGSRGWRALQGANGDPVITTWGSDAIFDHMTDIGGVQGNCPNRGINTTMQYCLFTESENGHDVGVQYWNNEYTADQPEGFVDFLFNATIMKSHRFPAVSSYPNTKYRVANNYYYRWTERHMNAYLGSKLDAIHNYFQEDIAWPLDAGTSHTKSQTFAIEQQEGYMPSVHLHDNWHFKNNGIDQIFAIDNSANMLHHSYLDDDVSAAYRATPMTPINDLPWNLLTTPEAVKNYALNNAGASIRYTANGSTTADPTELKFKNYAINRNENESTKAERISFSAIPLTVKVLTDFEKIHGFTESWATAHNLGASAEVHNEVTTNWTSINNTYAIINNAGYTNLEIYLAELAGDFHMLSKQALPVEYASPLQGQAKTNGILLSWRTEVEINADKFILQRLSQNDRWENIQTVLAGKYSYRVLDQKPEKGINLYRLKQIDLDNQFTFSNKVSVTWKGEHTPAILFPNPTTGTSNFEEGLFYKVEVINMLGQVVFLSEKTNEIPPLEKGVYSVTIFELEEQLSTILLVVE